MTITKAGFALELLYAWAYFRWAIMDIFTGAIETQS